MIVIMMCVFIYVRRKEDYLCLDEKSDVIELPIDEVFDISGWDLKKALKLLYKSNPSLLEWFASPIVYKETEEASYIKEVIPFYFSSKKLYCHYKRMAKTHLKYVDKEQIPVKKYLYILSLYIIKPIYSRLQEAASYRNRKTDRM